MTVLTSPLSLAHTRGILPGASPGNCVFVPSTSMPVPFSFVTSQIGLSLASVSLCYHLKGHLSLQLHVRAGTTGFLCAAFDT